MNDTAIILSIKPKYVSLILSNKKAYEYRRTIFKRNNITKVIIYASTPIQRVVGEFIIDHILYEDIDSLWRKTYKEAGIGIKDFYKYFMGKDKGYAIKIEAIKQYHVYKNIEEYGVKPPQSFCYV